MLNRYVSLAVCLCLLASISAFGQGNQGTGYVFALPGPNSSGSNLEGFVYNGSFLAPEIPSTVGPAGARLVIPKPDGSKFYVVGSNAGGLESTVDLSHFSAINGIAGSTCAAAITPNGRYLLVGASGIGSGASCGPSSNSNSLYILDTSTDSILSNTLSAPSAGIIGFAITPDSNTAYMLTNSPSTGAIVTGINLNTRGQTAKLNLPYGDATSITLSPQGLIYVTGGGAIYEIMTTGTLFTCNAAFAPGLPLCITPSGYMQVQATPGPLHFTPSGQVAYAVNSDPVGYNQSLVELTVSSHTLSTWPPANSGITPPAFSDVIIAGESLIYAISTTDPNHPTTLWDVNPSTLSAVPDTTFSMFSATSVISAVISNEVPSAVYLYALVANGNQTLLYRVNLATKSYVQELALLGPGQLQFAAVPPESGAAGFYVYNATQTVTAGGTSAPLTALVLDGTGRPVYNLPVSYAESTADPVTGVVISGATQTTNANGYATAIATVPTTPGTYTVVLTAGAATENFSLTVPGANTGPSGGGNPNNQVVIISGNGEFMQESYPASQPLTIQVNDTNGKPLVGVPVTFAITGDSIGQVFPTSTVTDSNGQASANFGSPNLPQGVVLAFDSTTVNASTSVGSVNFTETVYRVWPNGIAAFGGSTPQLPEFNIVTPVNRQLTVGEGDVLMNGVIESIQTTYPGYSQAVPNVGIRLASGPDFTQPGPASCQGSSLSDLNGLAHCNVYVSCQAGLGFVSGGISAVVGENSVVQMSLNVVKGTAQVLNIKSGNPQSGNAGGALANPLVATVTDNCGNPQTGVPVTWNITQGSATLNGTLSTSDSGGNVHTSVLLGQSPGTVLVTVAVGTSQVVFTITNQVVVSAITLTSGGGQAAFPNTAFAQPLVFVVTDVNQKPVQGINVTFSVATGSAAVNTTNATTDSKGQVSTTVNAGSSPGNVTVIAATGVFTASATLTVTAQGPNVNPNSFTNAATTGSTNPQIGLVPCGLNSVIGNGLASTISGVLVGNPLGIGPLPYSVGNVSISINGVAAPIMSVSNLNGVQQVNFQTPCETAPGSAIAVITVNGATTVVPSIQVLATQPGIINYAGPNNTPYGFVIRALDGSYVTPSNPAHRGEVYYMVLTGLGETTPPITTNAAGTGTQVIPLNQVIVGVNNVGVPATLAEYAQGQIGVYVIGFTIPLTAPTGTNQPLAVEVNGQFGNSVYLPGVI
jgi:uncharacterized protein (TIGR03437 family)